MPETPITAKDRSPLTSAIAAWEKEATATFGAHLTSFQSVARSGVSNILDFTRQMEFDSLSHGRAQTFEDDAKGLVSGTVRGKLLGAALPAPVALAAGGAYTLIMSHIRRLNAQAQAAANQHFTKAMNRVENEGLEGLVDAIFAGLTEAFGAMGPVHRAGQLRTNIDAFVNSRAELSKAHVDFATLKAEFGNWDKALTGFVADFPGQIEGLKASLSASFHTANKTFLEHNNAVASIEDWAWSDDAGTYVMVESLIAYNAFGAGDDVEAIANRMINNPEHFLGSAGMGGVAKTRRIYYARLQGGRPVRKASEPTTVIDPSGNVTKGAWPLSQLTGVAPKPDNSSTPETFDNGSHRPGSEVR